MSGLVDQAKKLVGKGTTLEDRVEGLRVAVESSRGRLPDELVDRAATTVERASARLAMTGRHTVVALAGATGSGKSSTFNALTDMDLAAVGVRRPTTSWTMACVWGQDPADPLLDWLEVPGRHRVRHDSMLHEHKVDQQLDGLVLLDLPDHDSTEVAHHVEVERLVQFADLLVWVLDPQKYADAAIHDRFLKPLATHKSIMLVVLNHIDEVPADRRASMVDDLKRLLVNDGLDGVPVLTTSAKLGTGIPLLKQEVADRVSKKKAAQQRLHADVMTAAGKLQDANGLAKPGDVARASAEELVDAFADAAGVPTVVKAVERSTTLRARRATGWPLTTWVGRLRRDPLKRLHLDLGAEGRLLTSGARTSLPEASAVQRARVDTAVRGVVEHVAADLAPPWADAVRRASTSRLDDLNDALDKAIGSTDLGVDRTPVWWRLTQVLQVLLFLAAVAGAGWLGTLAVMDYLRMDTPEPPEVAGLAIPALMLLGGVAAGVLIALASRVLVRIAARRKAARAESRLREGIAEVTEHLVIAPIEAELAAYRATREGLNQALRT